MVLIITVAIISILFIVWLLYAISVNNMDKPRDGAAGRDGQASRITSPHALQNKLLASTKLCPYCRYDLRGLPNGRRCPECGYYAQ